MASKLNFSAQLNLYTRGFEKGINSVKRQLKSLGGTFKSFAASMGAGLGIYQLVSQMSSVAKELNTAKTTLKNVSESMGDYNKSMQLAKNLARDYSQDMVSLTGNLASFQASAKGTGIALADVNEIFTSLTKASAYFNLSSQQTSQVLTAVAQMMSKGTVQAQELKLQLANVLPGAFSLMANAVGVTTSELDDLMSKGKLVAKDVLPKFAQELNKMTAGKINTNGLQLQMNRLKNTFTQFVESANVDKMLGKGVKALNDTLTWLLKNFQELQVAAVSLMAVLGKDKIVSFGTAFVNWIKDGKKHLDGLVQAMNKANRQVLINAEKNNLRLAHIRGAELAHANRQNYEAVRAAYTAGVSKNDLKPLWDAYLKSDKALESQRDKIKRIKTSIGELQHPWKNIAKQIVSINTVQNLIIAGLSALVAASIRWYKNAKEIKNALKEARKEAQAFEKEVNGKGKSAMAEQANILKANLDIYSDMLLGDKKRQAALNSINSILGLEGKKAFTLKSSYQDIVKEAKKWLGIQEKIAQVNAYSQGIADAEVKREEAQTKVADALMEGAKKAGWKKSVRQEFVTEGGQVYQKGDAQIKEGIKGNWRTRQETDEEFKERIVSAFKNSQAFASSSLVKAANDYSRNIYGVSVQTLQATANAAASSEAKFRDSIGKLLEEVGEDFAKTLGGGGNNNEDKDDEGKNTVKAKIDEYLKSAEELDNQLKRNAISAAEYKQQMDDLAIKTYRDITAFSDMEQQLKKLPKNYQKTADDIAKRFTDVNGMAMVADELEKYRQSLKELRNQVDNNTITDEEYNDSLQTLKSDTYKAISSVVNFGTFLDSLPKDIADALKSQLQGLGAAFKAETDKAMQEGAKGSQKTLSELWKKPSMTSGQITYSKDNDALENQKDVVEADIKAIEDAISELKNIEGDDWATDVNDAIGELTDMLDEAKKKAKSLDEAMAFNEAEKQVKDLRKSIVDNLMSLPDTFISLADGIKDVIGAFNQDIDFEKYDKVMGKIKAVINLINGVKSAVDTAMGIKELFGAFEKAKEAKDALEATTAAIQGMTLATQAQVVTDKAAAAASQEKSGANAGEVGTALAAAAASEEKAGASAKEAISESASSAAKIPVIGWIAAGVAIASVAGALISMFGKFATGGIVGGSSKHGDTNLVRANSGEMIMNGTQQKRLWNIIDGKSGIGAGSGGGEVKFRIRGSQLEGTLNNYRKQRRG